MNLQIALRTLSLLAAWLVLQNFNFATANDERRMADDCHAHGKNRESFCTANHLSSTVYLPPSTFHHLPSYKIKKVVLDAGHGGKDPGCLGAHSKEKDNALAIVLKLGELIKAIYPDVEVIYTRETDVFIELNERAAIANRHKADLFISVHCNAIKVSHVKGAETYVLGLHKTDENLEVAKRENASIYLEDNYQKNYEGYDPDSPEAHILGSVWQNAYLEQSILFADFVQQYAKSTAFREDKGVKQAGFLVLRETAMPAVLIETGFLTNRAEEDFIASEEGQTQMAQAIFEAFEAYKVKMEGATPEQPKNAPASVAKQTPAPKKTPPAAAPDNKPPSVQTSKPTEKQIEKQPAKPAKQPSGTPQKSQSGKASVPAESGPFRIFLLSWPIKMDKTSGSLGLIGDIKEEKIGEQYHYFTGNYATRTEAEKMLPEIKNLGFKTAVIMSAK